MIYLRWIGVACVIAGIIGLTQAATEQGRTEGKLGIAIGGAMVAASIIERRRSW